MSLSLYSWNVNGIRSALSKGFLNWFDQASPDILCLQETRAEEHQIDPAMAAPLGYHATWNPSRARKGYSGTAILSRKPPLEVELGLEEQCQWQRLSPEAGFNLEAERVVTDMVNELAGTGGFSKCESRTGGGMSAMATSFSIGKRETSCLCRTHILKKGL